MNLRMFAMLAVFAPMLVAAQTTGTVQGVITDAANGQPLANAQVRIDGTLLGALSDIAGRYTVPNVPTGRRVVIARRIGYAEGRREVDVSSGAPATADFGMTASATTLGEVVVTGTAAPTERRAVGTSIASVDSASISKSGAVTVDQALQGKIAGAQIMQNSGTPGGGGVSVRLRGTSSFISGSDPLYIVDGVIVDNSSRHASRPGRARQRAEPARRSQSRRHRAHRDHPRCRRGRALWLAREQRRRADLHQARTDRALANHLNTRVAQSELPKKLRINDYPFDIQRFPVTRLRRPGRLIFRQADRSRTTLSVDGGTEQTRYLLSGGLDQRRGHPAGTASDRGSARANLSQVAASQAPSSTSARTSSTRITTFR